MTLISKPPNFSCLCRAAERQQAACQSTAREACACLGAAAGGAGTEPEGAWFARGCRIPRGGCGHRSPGDAGQGRTVPAAVASGCPASDSCHAATPRVL